MVENHNPQQRFSWLYGKKIEKVVLCTCAHWAVSMDLRREWEKGKATSPQRKKRTPLF